MSTEHDPSEVSSEPDDGNADSGVSADAASREVTLQPELSRVPVKRRSRVLEVALPVAGLAAVGVALIVSAGPARQAGSEQPAEPANAATAVATPVATPMVAFAMPTCDKPEATGDTPQALGDPRARNSAQRGLDYLAKAATEWQKHNNCYGCHVQAVTVEALAVGRHNQYTVTDKDMREVLRGMLDLNGGARTPGGLNHGSPSIGQTGKLLGGAAFARYDQWVAGDLGDYMLTEARAILELQGSDGQVPMPWASRTVATGPIQATAHAIVTWKQAYERTADDQWLTAISRAEDWLHGTVNGWKAAPPSSMQDMNYALIGLLGAGVSNAEQVIGELAAEVLARQNADGGFALNKGGVSSPLSTGQTLYALRMLGRSDSDPAIVRGTGWLIEHQQSDGSWSSSGFGKAEAMWAVLGLVSVDVMSVTVEGLENGQHVAGNHSLAASARDNKGVGVTSIEVFVDDIRAYGVCAAALNHELDTTGWQPGKHVVEVRAYNARGQVSRRFLDVYAGDVYLTQIGTRFTGDGTEISLRNILEANRSSRVEVEIFAAVDKDGDVTAGDRVHSMSRAGRQGSMSFQWNGEGAEGAGNGHKYVARLNMFDEQGKRVQSEDVVFVHDTLQAQRASWAQLEGQLALPGGDVAQNAEVELVDGAGRVVGRTVSTKQGKFRFRNVKSKKGYKVRVKKQGFAAEAPAAAELGEDNKVDLQLQMD